jgi:hypothetical protein
LGRNGKGREREKEKDFLFLKSKFLGECFHILINQKKCMVWHGASQKIKRFKVLLHTRSKAKTRCDFGKDQGLARRKGKEERVTPEFGERKEEKILPPNSGCYNRQEGKPAAFVLSCAQVGCACSRGLQASAEERARDSTRRPVPFPARPTLYKRALVLPFIGVRRGSRCTMGV